MFLQEQKRPTPITKVTKWSLIQMLRKERLTSWLWILSFGLTHQCLLFSLQELPENHNKLSHDHNNMFFVVCLLTGAYEFFHILQTPWTLHPEEPFHLDLCYHGDYLKVSAPFLSGHAHHHQYKVCRMLEDTRGGGAKGGFEDGGRKRNVDMH